MNQQIKYRNRYNSPKGITIVALVVTIVIMLILVGVTVTIAINGGLIGTAKDSKEETRYTQVLAEKEMWEQEERPTERFGIKSETLEDFITRLENEKLLTKKEAEEVRKDGMTTIAKKWLVFGARKNVADASLWKYNLDEKTNLVTITKYLGTTDNLTELTIPNFLLIDGKEYRVTKIGVDGNGGENNPIANFDGNVIISKGITEIGWCSFSGANKITSVEIPNSVTLISDKAFQHCTSLTSIKIPGSVKKIGNYWNNVNGQVFNGCSNLKEVIFEEGIEEISGRAFDSCSKVEEWNLPKSLKRIGQWAFSSIGVEEFNIPENVENIADGFIGSSKLIKINVDPNNKYFTSIDGVLFDKAVTKLLKFPNVKQEENYTVPGTVKTINSYAFQSCNKIVKLIIGNSVENINSNALSECTIDTVEIGSNVSNISNNTFTYATLTAIDVKSENQNYESQDGILFNKGKTMLIKYPLAKKDTEYTIPDTVETILQNSFYGNNYLKNISIPSSVKKIENYAFGRCENIEKITIPEGVETIGDRILYCNSKIKQVTIPSTVTKLGAEAFRMMGGLTKITINKPEGSLSGKPWNASASVIIEWTGEQ